jgi:hypothetical protein
VPVKLKNDELSSGHNFFPTHSTGGKLLRVPEDAGEEAFSFLYFFFPSSNALYRIRQMDESDHAHCAAI